MRWISWRTLPDIAGGLNKFRIVKFRRCLSWQIRTGLGAPPWAVRVWFATLPARPEPCACEPRMEKKSLAFVHIHT
jgi:hypothetical protein